MGRGALAAVCAWGPGCSSATPLCPPGLYHHGLRPANHSHDGHDKAVAEYHELDLGREVVRVYHEAVGQC